MLKFEDVTTDYFDSVSFEIKKGDICKIVTESDFARGLIFNTMFVFNKPLSGKISLFGTNLITSSKHEATELFKKTGIIWRYGGLISNLTVMENILLPSEYFEKNGAESLAKDVIIEMFEKTGFNVLAPGYLNKKCGPLPIHEKRLINIIRTFICEPDLMIYDSVFEGFSLNIHDGLIQMVKDFHNKKTGRTSIFLYSRTEEDTGNDVKTDIVIRQKGKNFVVEKQE